MGFVTNHQIIVVLSVFNIELDATILFKYAIMLSRNTEFLQAS